jgi:hypothetical protein
MDALPTAYIKTVFALMSRVFQVLKLTTQSIIFIDNMQKELRENKANLEEIYCKDKENLVVKT